MHQTRGSPLKSVDRPILPLPLLKMKLKQPKIQKTAKNRYLDKFHIRKYSDNAHLHGNGFKSMFLPIKILEPRFF